MSFVILFLFPTVILFAMISFPVAYFVWIMLDRIVIFCLITGIAILFRGCFVHSERHFFFKELHQIIADISFSLTSLLLGIESIIFGLVIIKIISDVF